MTWAPRSRPRKLSSSAGLRPSSSFRLASLRAPAFATAAAVVCAIPVVGWIACAILAAIAVVITIAGFFNGLSATAKPSVFDPKTGKTLSTLENLQDILFVKGDWIFDTAHEGWNEIHPIRDCVIIAEEKMTVGGPWPTNIGDNLGLDTDANVKITLGRWCRMLDDARDAEEDGSRDDPANDWILHPSVDSCQDIVIL